jgi:exopolysaccharide biosynthesis protein
VIQQECGLFEVGKKLCYEKVRKFSCKVHVSETEGVMCEERELSKRNKIIHAING